MDMSSSAKWLSEMGIEEPALIRQCQKMSSLDDHPHPINFDNSSFSPESYSSSFIHSLDHNPAPAPPVSDRFGCKQLRTAGCSWESESMGAGGAGGAGAASSHSSQAIISFGGSEEYCSSPTATARADDIQYQKWSSHNDSTLEQTKPPEGKNCGGRKRTVIHAQEHVMAERKRREKLNQRFLALSSILPGLKKLDKGSILAHAVKYLKQLEEQVKTLEGKTAKKSMESVVYVKKSGPSLVNHDNALSDENYDGNSGNQLPEIEARVSDNDILVRILCEKRKGVVSRIIGELRKFQLNVVNTNTMSFGNYTLDITIIAQKDDEFYVATKDLVKSLRKALQSCLM